MGTNGERSSSFFILPFSTDGKAVGKGFWEKARLTARWLDLCKEILALHGEEFDESLGGDLSHIRLKLTAACGAAVVTFYVHGNVALSVLLQSGASVDAERSVAQMYVNSLKEANPVQVSAATLWPFSEVLTALDRPLMVVIPFPHTAISDEDHGLVRELALHLAGTFFTP